MKPTPSSVHVNAPLTNMSVAYMQSASAFIARRAFPVVPVQKQSDRYYVYSQADFYRNQMQKRAPGAPAAETGYSVDNTPTYYCDVFGLTHPIPDETRANSDSVLSPDMDGTDFLTLQGLIKEEVSFATDFLTTSVWGTDITGSATPSGATQALQWDDDSSRPLTDVTTGSQTIHQNTGYRPNKLILGRQVYNALRNHPDILDRVKYGQTAGAPAMVTPNLLAQLMELDEVLIMDAVYNTAKEGQTASYSFIGGKVALLLYTPPRPALRTPSAGYTFVWSGLTDLNNQGQVIYRRRDDKKHADEIEIGSAWDQNKVAAALGYFFTSIVA